MADSCTPPARANRMGELVSGDDGLPAEEVGEWVEDKHRVLVEYLGLHAGPRAGFIGPRKPGATYVDVFCGPGRAKIKTTGKYVDGSALVAWKASVAKKAPFTQLYIADKNTERRKYCAERLQRLGAPVVEVPGDAAEAASAVRSQLDPYGFHFAFIDPYSLGALGISILENLADLRRMDLLVHLSAMDLFRNFEKNVAAEQAEFEKFAPDWRKHVRVNLPDWERRHAVIEYWKGLVDTLGMAASAEMHPIHNSVNRVMYWLLLISRHDLAQKFWKIVLKSGPQPDLFG